VQLPVRQYAVANASILAANSAGWRTADETITQESRSSVQGETGQTNVSAYAPDIAKEGACLEPGRSSILDMTARENVPTSRRSAALGPRLRTVPVLRFSQVPRGANFLNTAICVRRSETRPAQTL